MKKVISCVMRWRSLPSIVIYFLLKKETKDKIKKDISAMGIQPKIFVIHELLLYNPVFRRLFFTRVLSESTTKYRLIRWTYKPMESLEISSVSNNIGGGLQIFHGYSTIVYCYSMGENCSIYQNVTVGRGKSRDGIDVPIIGNNVTIYAGAVVIGGIRIGDNVKIGAGAVVVKDVPSNTTVVGSPTRILN